MLIIFRSSKTIQNLPLERSAHRLKTIFSYHMINKVMKYYSEKVNRMNQLTFEMKQ